MVYMVSRILSDLKHIKTLSRSLHFTFSIPFFTLIFRTQMSHLLQKDTYISNSDRGMVQLRKRSQPSRHFSLSSPNLILFLTTLIRSYD